MCRIFYFFLRMFVWEREALSWRHLFYRSLTFSGREKVSGDFLRGRVLNFTPLELDIIFIH